MDTSFQIGSRTVGYNSQPFIIAEMSGNHNQSLEKALSIVDAAANSGAHALKLQTYTPDTMTIDVDRGAFKIEDNGLWHGRSLHELYKSAFTPWEWHKPIFDRCRKRGLIGFSSVFDTSSVDFLESVGVELYKIASLELTDVELVARVARTGKPMILSTGMASVSEIADSVSVARQNGAASLVLLRCTSAYPAAPDDAHLANIPMMRQLFGCEAGLSDHTLGTHVAVAAVALGASVIEKHFTINRADGGVDSAFSLEPDEMARLVQDTWDARQAIGVPLFGGSASEATAMSHRRTLYVVRDMSPGDKINDENVRAIRPGEGLPVKYLSVLRGMKVRHAITRGTPLSWSLFK